MLIYSFILQNLEKFVSGETPVIYFSLGSVAQGFAMPDELRENVINAFKGLPYKVVKLNSWTRKNFQM